MCVELLSASCETTQENTLEEAVQCNSHHKEVRTVNLLKLSPQLRGRKILRNPRCSMGSYLQLVCLKWKRERST